MSIAAGSFLVGERMSPSTVEGLEAVLRGYVRTGDEGVLLEQLRAFVGSIGEYGPPQPVHLRVVGDGSPAAEPLEPCWLPSVGVLDCLFYAQEHGDDLAGLRVRVRALIRMLEG